MHDAKLRHCGNLLTYNNLRMMKNFTNPHAQMRQAKALALWKFVFLLLLTAQIHANDGYAQNAVNLTEKNVPRKSLTPINYLIIKKLHP